MNVLVTAIMCVVSAILGFCIGCFTLITKIEQLQNENKILKEWLEASQKTNEVLRKENNELLVDLESVVNGGHIMASTITADLINANGEIQTKTD